MPPVVLNIKTLFGSIKRYHYLAVEGFLTQKSLGVEALTFTDLTPSDCALLSFVYITLQLLLRLLVGGHNKLLLVVPMFLIVFFNTCGIPLTKLGLLTILLDNNETALRNSMCVFPFKMSSATHSDSMDEGDSFTFFLLRFKVELGVSVHARER